MVEVGVTRAVLLALHGHDHLQSQLPVGSQEGRSQVPCGAATYPEMRHDATRSHGNKYRRPGVSLGSQFD